MTNSNNQNNVFELPKKQPSVKLNSSNENIPEDLNNALSSINLEQANKSNIQESFQKEIAVEDKQEVTIENKQEFPKKRTAIEIIEQLKKKQKYEEVMLPSRNFTYGHLGLNADAPIHVRPMTIEEEKVISTPRLIRSGQALDKIFESCIYENVPPNKLLSIDRTFLLFYIRGISYGPEYEIEVKCPSCDAQFEEEISIDMLPVERCKDDFTGIESYVLPDSGLQIKYRIPTAEDEKILSRHKDMMIKGGFRNDTPDDTIIRRNILLINQIEDITNKIEIEQIINNLSVKDSNYIRELINNPGFGLSTDITIRCQYCYHEWEADLPIDANFFFPRMTKRTS